MNNQCNVTLNISLNQINNDLQILADGASTYVLSKAL
jgi:hypothetical protein